MVPDLPLKTLDGEACTLHSLRGGESVVVDFWTTACPRCPAALEKLNKIAANSDRRFLAVCLGGDPGDKAEPYAALTHAYASLDVKEEAKKHWGFRFVPFVAVINEDGVTELSGACDAVIDDLQPPPSFVLDEDF